MPSMAPVVLVFPDRAQPEIPAIPKQEIEIVSERRLRVTGNLSVVADFQAEIRAMRASCSALSTALGQ